MRALVLAATAVAALVTAVAVQPASGQADLPNTGGAFEDDNGDYHEAAINAIAADGITKGCAEDRYCPSLSVTRAQMASFLVRAYRLGTRAGKMYRRRDPGKHALRCHRCHRGRRDHRGLHSTAFLPKRTGDTRPRWPAFSLTPRDWLVARDECSTT